MGFLIDLIFIPIKLITSAITFVVVFLATVISDFLRDKFVSSNKSSSKGYTSVDDLIRTAEAEGRLIEMDENGDIFVETRDSKNRRDQGIEGQLAYKKAELYL